MSWRTTSTKAWRAKGTWQFTWKYRGRSYALAALAWTAWLALLGAAATRADDFGIFVMKVDGGKERKVAQVEGFGSHGSPRWSHDGQRLAFEASEGPNNAAKFYIVNLDGTQLQEMGEHGSPDWSPDDKQLVFHHFGGGMRAGVWVQRLDGTERNWLVEGSWPRWSADGGKIAFSDGQTIRVLDLVENEDRLLVDVPFAQRPTAFDWSHDGKRLAFFARTNADSPRELFIASDQGMNTGLKPRLVGEGMFGGHVTWSPDDKQLAFTIGSFIHVLDVEGVGKPQRLPGQPQKSRDPAWSPDGQWIAFARRPQ